MSIDLLFFSGIFLFSAQYLAQYLLAYKFKYDPIMYYTKGLVSMSFKTESFNMIKILFVLLIGPIIEIYFILFGIFFQISEITITGILWLASDYYVFKKIYDLFKYKQHFKHFGYFCT